MNPMTLSPPKGLLSIYHHIGVRVQPTNLVGVGNTNVQSSADLHTLKGSRGREMSPQHEGGIFQGWELPISRGFQSG